MRQTLFIICYLFVSVAPAAAQMQMRDVFAAMPDSVLPMVTKNNRLDCIDFIENNMEARVRNKVDTYVTLEALTSDYARFRTSEASVMELKLLPTSDSTAVLCIVTTAESGKDSTALRVEDSNIRFLTADWTPLSVPVHVEIPSLDAFFYASDSSHDATLEQARSSLADFHPLRMQLAPDENTLTLTLQTSRQTKAEKAAIGDLVHPVVLRWNGSTFVMELN